VRSSSQKSGLGKKWEAAPKTDKRKGEKKKRQVGESSDAQRARRKAKKARSTATSQRREGETGRRAEIHLLHVVRNANVEKERGEGKTTKKGWGKRDLARDRAESGDKKKSQQCPAQKAKGGKKKEGEAPGAPPPSASPASQKEGEVGDKKWMTQLGRTRVTPSPSKKRSSRGGDTQKVGVGNGLFANKGGGEEKRPF